MQQTQIFGNEIGEQQFSFRAERFSQPTVKSRVLGERRIELPQLQPLRGEIVDQCSGFRIAQHAARLFLEYSGLMQPARNSRG
jgi:hypothetical protein